MARNPSTLSILLLGTFAWLAWTPDSLYADLIVLKDGTILYGKAKRESERYVDPDTGEGVTVPKGFFYVDSGPRRQYFSTKQLSDVQDYALPPARMIVRKKKIVFIKPTGLRGMIDSTPLSEWDDEWNRVVRVHMDDGRRVALRQHLTVLSPRLALMDSYTKHKWNAFYLIDELGPQRVLALLKKHPDYTLDGDLSTEEQFRRRFTRFQFFYYSGWHKEADELLQELYKDFPKEKGKLDEGKAKLLSAWGRDYVKSLKQAQRSGRHEWLQAKLNNIDERFTDPRVVKDLQLLQLEYDQQNDKFAKIKSRLKELAAFVKSDEEKKIIDEALAVVLADIDFHSLDRFEAFLLHSAQPINPKATDEEKEKKAVSMLSLAISGYILGSEVAETSFETTEKLWIGRKFLIEYLKASVGAGEKLLSDYLINKYALSADILAEVLAKLPPVFAVENPPKDTFKRTIDGIDYFVQLPDEYHHRKSWPVLFVLHESGMGAKDMLERWQEEAKREGYILVAPQWHSGFNTAYNYTAEEHDAVLKPLMDMRKHFNVADDRVFLFGLGQGANMAFDVGLSHPDYFAGVVPMGANIHMVTRRYWPNAQYLPFYVVGGDHAGDPNVEMRKQFDYWIPHGYQALFVQYKGRGREWFGGELPHIFEWMNHKKRYMPLTRLGRDGSGDLGDKFTTHRPTDNSFYWMTIDKISPICENGEPSWSGKKSPATFTAVMHHDRNLVVLFHRGLKKITIWFGRRGQINYDKPVRIRVGLRVVRSEKIQPSVRTLLEHYRERWDRGRLFIAKIELGK